MAKNIIVLVWNVFFSANYRDMGQCLFRLFQFAEGDLETAMRKGVMRDRRAKEKFEEFLAECHKVRRSPAWVPARLDTLEKAGRKLLVLEGSSSRRNVDGVMYGVLGVQTRETIAART